MTLRGRAAAAAAAVGIACVAVPASAGAVSISSLTTQPTSTQAGSHPNFVMQLRFGEGDSPKGMTINLPPGLVGNPNAVTKCPQATFNAGGCGPESAVGSTTVYVRSGAPVIGSLPGPNLPGTGGGSGANPVGGLLGGVVGGLGNAVGGLLGGGSRAAAPRAAASRAKARALELPIEAPGTVYVLEPNPGEPARLGIEVTPVGGLLGTIRLQSPVSLRDTSDYGLTSDLDGLPQTFAGMNTTITGMDLTLNGTLANGNSFITLPTSCGPATTTVSTTGYNGPPATASASFTPTGCGDVPFTPSLSVAPQTTQADSPSGYAVTLGVPGDENPIHQAHVSRVIVTLPEGATLNPGAADGLESCSEAGFARGSRSAPNCPAASVIGSVAFTSPLVGTLSGTVYEGQPTPQNMLRLFVDVPGPGLRIKLLGLVDTDPRTGRVTSTFADLPQLPFTAFTLAFRGGDKAILTTPLTCGPATSVARLEPFTGTEAATPTSAFGVSMDGKGGECPNPPAFDPSIDADVRPATAGAATAMTTTISRPDRTQRLSDMAISFPPGLLGGLGDGIGLCDLDKAKAGKCPADSRVGSAKLVAGPGKAPLDINGDVFLTAPIDGSLAGLAITVPGKVGPFDLGTTVSFARIVVRPDDAGLNVTAAGLPQILGGIPLDLRQIQLKLDRKGFMRNATSCAEQQLQATFTASDGQGASRTAPYRATDCDKVPFKPRIGGTIGGKGEVRKGGHPAVTAVVSQGPGEISTRSASVVLPKQIGVAIERLNRSCPEGQDCGDRNVVGTAKAVTPLLPIPLSGPVRLVTPAAGGLPVLKVQLSGLLNLELTGKTALTKDGRVQNTFAGIPDVPLSRFELALKGGKDGILLAVRSLCGAKPKGDAEFGGHNGATRRTTGTFKVKGCTTSAASKAKKHKKAKRHAKHHKRAKGHKKAHAKTHRHAKHGAVKKGA